MHMDMDSFHSSYMTCIPMDTDSADLIWSKQQYYWERVAVQLVRTRGSSGHSRQLPHSLLNSGSTPRIFIGLQGHTDTLAPQRHC